MATQTEIMKFTNEDRTDAILLAVGAASACWDENGVFQSDTALIIARELEEYLRSLDQPNIGLATTGQLLDELTARIQLDYYNGGGGLYYTTVHGRP